jgi:L-glutamine-phosphate cytidylyltransferase
MTNLILLAAGRGSRLGKLTDHKPKAMNVYNGKPIIKYIIENAKNGPVKFSKIVIVGGYRYQMLSNLGAKLIVNHNWKETGPLYSLRVAEEFLNTDDSIVSYTDLLYDTEYWQESLNLPDEIVVPSNVNFLNSWSQREIDLLSDIESFKVKNDYIAEIGKTVVDLGEVQGQFAGIVKFTPKGWRRFSEVVFSDNNVKKDMTTSLCEYLESGGVIRTVSVNAPWREFDNPEDFNLN